MKAMGHFLFSVGGRESRSGLVKLTIAFLVLGLSRVQLSGVPSLQMAFLGLQLALVVPLLICLPIRRFHDMNRSGRWLLVFAAGVLLGGIFLVFGMAQEARSFGLEANAAIANAAVFREAVELAQAHGDGAKINAIMLGGFSLALCFWLVQIG